MKLRNRFVMYTCALDILIVAEADEGRLVGERCKEGGERSEAATWS